MRPTFVAQDTALARIPLGAAMRGPDAAGGEDSLLREAVFLASRQVRAPDASCPAQGRLACTWRGYEIRLRERTTPHGVFAGVAVARFADGSPRLRLGGEHRVRTTPSASWLAVLGDRTLEDPGVLPQLVLATSTLLTRRGGRYHSEQRGNGSWATSRASSVRVTEVTSCVIKARVRANPSAEAPAGPGVNAAPRKSPATASRCRPSSDRKTNCGISPRSLRAVALCALQPLPGTRQSCQ